MAEAGGYADWRSVELAIKDAAKKAAREAGPGVSAATVDAQIRQARFDRFLSRVFAAGEQSEWLLRFWTLPLTGLSRNFYGLLNWPFPQIMQDQEAADLALRSG